MPFVEITNNRTKVGFLTVICCLLVLGFYSNSIDKPQLTDDTEANIDGIPHQASSLPDALDGVAREIVEDVAPAINHTTDLAGVVIDRLGLPISNASIAVLSQPIKRQVPAVVPYFTNEDDSTRIIKESISDSEGRFVFVLEPGVTYDLSISAAGFGSVRRTAVFAGQAMTVVLDKESSIWGIVSDYKTGKAIAGAHMTIRPGGLSGVGTKQYSVYSSADGSYEVTDLPSDAFSIYASAAGFANTAVARPIVLKEGAAMRYDIVMERGNTVWGTITDAESKLPIIGAVVRSVAKQQTITDVNGEYVLEGIAKTMNEVISVSAAKYGRYDYPVSATAIPPQGLELNLSLLPGRSVRGVVIDEHSNPISGAYVSLAGDLSRPEYGAFDVQRDNLFTRTDDDGTFFIEDLRVDVRHTLYLAATGFGSEVFDLPESEWDSSEIDLGKIVLYKGSSISGRVLAMDDIPIVGIWVALHGSTDRRDELGPHVDSSQGYKNSGGFGLGSIGVRTDERGRFFFNELPAGQYYLLAGNKGSINGAEKELSLENDEQLTEVMMYLDEGLSIEGVVFDEAGLPIAGQSVSLGNGDNPLPRVTYNLTKADGSFRFSGLEAGSFSLWCDGGFVSSNSYLGSGRFTDVVVSGIQAGSKNIKIVLPKAKLTQGVVVDSNGEAAAMVNVYIEQHGWLMMLDTTNSRGEFAIWLDPKKNTPVHFYPAPEHVYLQWAWHYDLSNKIDMSYELVLNDIAAGQEGVVVNLTTQ